MMKTRSSVLFLVDDLADVYRVRPSGLIYQPLIAFFLSADAAPPAVALVVAWHAACHHVCLLIAGRAHPTSCTC